MPIWLALLIFGAGLALMYNGYRRFRYGEQYELRTSRAKKSQIVPGLDNPLEILNSVTNTKDVEEWIRRLS